MVRRASERRPGNPNYLCSRPPRTGQRRRRAVAVGAVVTGYADLNNAIFRPRFGGGPRAVGHKTSRLSSRLSSLSRGHARDSSGDTARKPGDLIDATLCTSFAKHARGCLTRFLMQAIFSSRAGDMWWVAWQCHGSWRMRIGGWKNMHLAGLQDECYSQGVRSCLLLCRSSSASSRRYTPPCYERYLTPLTHRHRQARSRTLTVLHLPDARTSSLSVQLLQQSPTLRHHRVVAGAAPADDRLWSGTAASRRRSCSCILTS